MTISTLTFQTNAVAQMDALETALSQTQSQLSTGKQLQSAADNPTAMTEVNLLNAQLSASQQQVSNGNLVTSGLQLEQNALTNATTALQSARDIAIEGNNSDLSLTERQGLVAQLQQLQQTLLASANSQDAQGNYQVNQVQISPDQSLSVGDAGSAVFMNIPAGNGTFTTAAAAANTGSASIDPGSLTSPAAWVPGVYTVA